MSGVYEDGHLGGYRIGGDEATFYPHLWAWLVSEVGVRSVLDVGCGDGVAVRFFRDELACSVAVGVDGVPQEDPSIVQHDYTLGPLPFGLSVPPPSPLRDETDFDLVWSCEFVEHVEERFLPNFVDTFQHGRRVLLTHAEPGQLGYHHVNCRTADYWVGVMAAAGFRLDDDLTGACRAVAAANPSPWNHFARSGLAFETQ